MKSLLIIGYGEYGHVVEELASACGYEKIAALDDNASDSLDKIANYKKYKNEYADFVVAIGNPEVRKKLTEEISDTYNLVTIIHPTEVINIGA